MTQNRTRNITGKLCGLLIFAILLVGIPTLIYDIYYDLNDDTMIKDILSGAYTGEPSAYSIQMLYPVSWIISMLYRAIPGLPWYGLFLCLCQFGVFVLIAWRIMNIVKGRIATFAALMAELFIAFGVFLRELVIVQYSVTSGLCMAGAVFLFITCKRTEKATIFFRQNIVPVLLVVLAFMIRTEVCLMLMPFLLLAGVSAWMYEEKIFAAVNIRKYVTLIMSALLCMLVVASIDRLAYGESEWNSFRSFFDARTKLYDFYGIPSYDENKEFYDKTGLSRESYTLLENYNFSLDDSIDSWTLEMISEYQKQRAYNGDGLSSTFGYVSKNSLKDALWMYKNNIVSGFKSLSDSFFSDSANTEIAIAIGTYSVIGAYVIYLLVCFMSMASGMKVKAIIKIITLFLIRSVLWIYLYMVDRAIGRVTTPLIMLELVVIIGFIINDLPCRDKDNEAHDNKIAAMFNGMTNTIVVILSVMFLSAALINNFKLVSDEYNSRKAADDRWNALMEYCRAKDENYYVIDVYSSTSFNGASYSEKVFKNVDNSYKNFDICGGWAAKSPIAKQKLKKSGLNDIKTSLYSEKNTTKTYFVATVDKDLGWLKAFYAKRGHKIETDCIDTITTDNGEVAFNVYELRKTQD